MTIEIFPKKKTFYKKKKIYNDRVRKRKGQIEKVEKIFKSVPEAYYILNRAVDHRDGVFFEGGGGGGTDTGSIMVEAPMDPVALRT